MLIGCIVLLNLDCSYLWFTGNLKLNVLASVYRTCFFPVILSFIQKCTTSSLWTEPDVINGSQSLNYLTTAISLLQDFKSTIIIITSN